MRDWRSDSEREADRRARPWLLVEALAICVLVIVGLIALVRLI